ncbi:hypothetical protein K1719_020557 [Acacia pycnantha]|nr:hypothetical protein K1719_020557 [Acacia pycnantha]
MPWVIFLVSDSRSRQDLDEALMVGAKENTYRQSMMVLIQGSTLMLRPGRYEIKFLVDGEWKLSPEFPTVDGGICVR